MNGHAEKASALPENELRQRLPQQPEKPQHAKTVDQARKTVMELNAQEEKADKDESEKRTFGRTPDGTGRLLAPSQTVEIRHFRA